MPESFDLDAYFRRIGYSGPARPDLETLSAIHARHVDVIPFETLDPLLGRPVKLDLGSLQAKLVASRRGGYCFEQNAVFTAALEAIGFQVTPLGARVRWMSPPDAPLGPRLHMLLKVDLADGAWLADVGFGANLLDQPLRLQPATEQSTPAARYRLDLDGGLHALRAWRGDDWRVCYVFNLEPQLPSDYAVANWFTSTSAEGPFTSMLIVERLSPACRYNLVNTRLTETWRDGRIIERNLQSAAELGETLDATFGIEPPAPIGTVFAKVAGG